MKYEGFLHAEISLTRCSALPRQLRFAPLPGPLPFSHGRHIPKTFILHDALT